MRILICCNVYPPHFVGGAELVAHYQGKSLVATGHDVQVFTGDSQPLGQRHDLRTESYDGLTVHRVHLTHIDYSPEYVNFSHPLVEEHFSSILATFRPDVVHCHNIIGLSVKILQIAHEFGAKVVLTLHDHWGFCFKNTIMKHDGITCTDFSKCAECLPFIDDGDSRQIPMRMRQDFMKMAMSAVDVFISPSQYLANTYLEAGFPQEKMHVIWNGIDLNKFTKIAHSPSNDKVRFSFFGYFGRHKGIHTLLDAIPFLKNRHHVLINLIGDGDQRASYAQQLHENGYADHVKFWGKIDNNEVVSAYSETDVLVLPSIWRENQPVSITEAMACSIPVIGSNMGGIPELVENGVSGLIFEAGNVVDLAEKMDNLIANRSLAEEMGLNGRKTIQENSFATQVEKLLHLYLANSPTPNKCDSFSIIACVGKHINETCAQAITQLAPFFEKTETHIVMADWLTETQLREARLAWVIDNTTTADIIVEVALKGLVLLCPEPGDDLLKASQKYLCNCFYQNADDATDYIIRYIGSQGSSTLPLTA